ncbi:MAG: hypothetical protein RLZZ450_1679 [Pseudomonadota bacterium]|jgi:predicted RNA-binding protein (virulence factor B family)
MALSDLLGYSVKLTVQRIVAQGAYLSGDALLDLGDDGEPNVDERLPDDGTLLLPIREVPEDAAVGDELEVFIYLDSEDRPIATTQRPRLTRGEVCFMTVTAVTRIGAFVDWGMSKELLVPFAEQTSELAPGQSHAIGLLLDRSERLCGTMRVRELLYTGGRFDRDEIVEGEAWREEPGIGVFCILERKYVGLLPASEPHNLRRGEQTTFRIQHVLADGKVELSLRGHVHEELETDAAHVLSVLLAKSPEVGDKSSPEKIRSLFGLSKKAFKRAAGRLLKDGAASIDRAGFLVPLRKDD